MIGVLADAAERDVVREFFELFKTPWEFFREEHQYDVLLCAGDWRFEVAAKLVLVFAGKKTESDEERKSPIIRQRKNPCRVLYQGNQLPLYGESISFRQQATGLLTDVESHECVAFLNTSRDQLLARIGYDLFSEVRTLLTIGQPPANADIPTLELHIAFLRDLITGCGFSLVEIPPVPEGVQFVACLTHDVDHPSVRQHKLDHTIVGFLLRAVLGSLVDTLLGRMSFRDAVKNWIAAIELPLVHLGLAKDFWRDFDQRYLEIEEGLPSTFFVIPRKNYPGRRVDGSAPALRAASYEARELADTICRLRAAGCEVGLHGIDAWIDSSTGSAELEEVCRLTGVAEAGVRMHWLYYDEKSPATLEKAGAAYDSTIGYNETVGYRAGTTQAYKPLGAEQLFELPMHAMDTALFYLSYLGLSPRKASARLRQLADNAVQYGGCLTINWHDRSLAPERLWGGCYRQLIQELKNRGAWFATGGQAVAWFRKRRSVIFESGCGERGAVRAKVMSHEDNNLPGLRLRTHEARSSKDVRGHRSSGHVDVAVDETVETSVSSVDKS